ncbi:hypothetical protein ACIOZM_15030 [Pseudomonas sp. NPDC087346]|uniref:hypothetical protein n=1 Tax=Pseudomonas sp. NPDC087346 TaxID=3364438 RepID=UPI00382ECBE0
MAMFDLKDSEVVNLKDCHTDASTLVKGENITRLDVSNSSAVTQPSARPATPKWSILRWLAKNVVVTLLIAILGGLVVGYLNWHFGWTK